MKQPTRIRLDTTKRGAWQHERRSDWLVALVWLVLVVSAAVVGWTMTR
jgi:hypothetical protein